MQHRYSAEGLHFSAFHCTLCIGTDKRKRGNEGGKGEEGREGERGERGGVEERGERVMEGGMERMGREDRSYTCRC